MKSNEEFYRTVRKKGVECDLVLVCRKGFLARIEIGIQKIIIPDLKFCALAPIFYYRGKIFKPGERGRLAEILGSGDFKKICVVEGNLPISISRWLDLMDYAKKSGKWQIFVRFVVVGIMGILVNLAFFFILHGMMGVNDLISLAWAIEGSTIITYILNERFVFLGRKYRLPLGKRFILYHGVLLMGLLINIAIYYPLSFILHYLVADFVGVTIASLWSFYMNNAYIFAGRR